MKYDFDEIISRRNSNSYKWDAVMEEGVLPMWVADMDFRTAPWQGRLPIRKLNYCYFAIHTIL